MPTLNLVGGLLHEEERMGSLNFILVIHSILEDGSINQEMHSFQAASMPQKNKLKTVIIGSMLEKMDTNSFGF